MDASTNSARAEMLAVLPRLRRFARALTRNATDADDLVQDTIERALKNLHRWTPGTRMDSWMYKIAQNLWLDTLRSRRVRACAPGEQDTNPSMDGVRAAETGLLLSKTQDALNELPAEQRVVVALVLIEGLSYREAATVLDVPLGTVTSRLARAREALAARVLGEEIPGLCPGADKMGL